MAAPRDISRSSVLTSKFELKYLYAETSYAETEEDRNMMPPPSWYRLEELSLRESTLRRAAARYRDLGHLRRRHRRRRR
jgi:hypothetical protein